MVKIQLNHHRTHGSLNEPENDEESRSGIEFSRSAYENPNVTNPQHNSQQQRGEGGLRP